MTTTTSTHPSFTTGGADGVEKIVAGVVFDRHRQTHQKDCMNGGAFGKKYSPTRYNGALGIVRHIFEIAVEHGYRVDNPAKFVDRRR